MWLLPDDDALVLAVNHHVSVHVVSQGVDVGGVLVLSLRRDVNNGKYCHSLRPWEKRFGRVLPDRSDISSKRLTDLREPAYSAAELLQSASGVFP